MNSLNVNSNSNPGDSNQEKKWKNVNLDIILPAGFALALAYYFYTGALSEESLKKELQSKSMNRVIAQVTQDYQRCLDTAMNNPQISLKVGKDSGLSDFIHPLEARSDAQSDREILTEAIEEACGNVQIQIGPLTKN